jgi:hypothetical protein
MKHTGGCHCGGVRYEVESTLDPVIACNCSICGKKGHWLSFVAEKDFRLLSGEDLLTDYQFGKKIIHHIFCSKCGVGSFMGGTAPDGRKMIAVNVRCIDGVDLEAVLPKLVQVDGKSVV